MIDKTKPAPMICVDEFEDGWSAFVYDHDEHFVRGLATEAEAIAESHRLYAEMAAPAVIDFAERVAAWLFDRGDNQMTPSNREYDALPSDGRTEAEWLREQIIAAARGERSMR